VTPNAAATAALSSEALRFKSLTILGSVYAVPFDVLAEHYRRLVVTEAWRR
jgi:hypothetical protein